MKQKIKSFLERHTFLGSVARKRRMRRWEQDYAEWEEKGAVLPLPRLGKYREMLRYIERFSPEIFIETGTYTGHTVYAMLVHFKRIHSIELDAGLAEKATRRFSGHRHVHIHHGESERTLPVILKEVKGPCLFWLDAHYSGTNTAIGDSETPIIHELSHILAHPFADQFIVLIDDARCFTGMNDYPTLDALREYIRRMRPDWSFDVDKDIIRTHPGKYSLPAASGLKIKRPD